jgi:hypothetical protein
MWTRDDARSVSVEDGERLEHILLGSEISAAFTRLACHNEQLLQHLLLRIGEDVLGRRFRFSLAPTSTSFCFAGRRLTHITCYKCRSELQSATERFAFDCARCFIKLGRRRRGAMALLAVAAGVRGLVLELGFGSKAPFLGGFVSEKLGLLVEKGSNEGKTSGCSVLLSCKIVPNLGCTVVRSAN